MNNNDDNFTTPKQTKRLGLKRNNSALKEPSSSKILTGSIAKAPTVLVANDTTRQSTPRRLPQSDVRVNYRNLESNEGSPTKDISNTPGTPKSTAHILEKQRQAVSTNCRPYRLALSKKMREKMTKKRLEFHLANELAKEEEADEQESESQQLETNTNQGNACINQLDIREKYENADKASSDELFEEMSKHELMTKIEMCREELSARQDHAKKVKELQEAINTWKIGFSSALNDLQQKIEPRLDTESLLQKLHIPQEMLKYVND